MSVAYRYEGPAAEIASREILGRRVADHHARALHTFAARKSRRWTVELGAMLFFDAAGLALVDRAVREYRGGAARLEIELAVDDAAWRDYYSLGTDARFGTGRVRLPIVAVRPDAAGPSETLVVSLPASREPLPLPAGLAPATEASVPHALLMEYHGPFDLLFANQIALASALRREVRRHPWTWIKALVRRAGVAGIPQRLARAYTRIDRRAEVHPTAVIEGSVVGPRARIGAHCVVRYSVIGEHARLHDGAKAEFSVVGAGAWLMHDLVLLRSVAEAGVFLIHGPYQFSYFQRDSGAFATILMDYRPDGKPIQVKTGAGLRPFGGVFLGSVLGEGARTLGGCLLAPGRIVPAGTWLAADPESIHTLDEEEMPARRPVPPRASRRRVG